MIVSAVVGMVAALIATGFVIFLRRQLWREIAGALPTVFISYRRDDSFDVARRLHDHFVDKERIKKVFFDLEKIDGGQDFDRRIRSALNESETVFVVIGPNWEGQSKDGSRQRIFENDDWVCREVELAIANGNKVVPVLVSDRPMPAKADVPEILHPLLKINAMKIDGGSTNKDFAYRARQLAKLARNNVDTNETTRRLQRIDLYSFSMTALPLVLTMLLALVAFHSVKSDLIDLKDGKTYRERERSRVDEAMVTERDRVDGAMATERTRVDFAIAKVEEFEKKKLRLDLSELVRVAEQVDPALLLPEGNVDAIFGFRFETEAIIRTVDTGRQRVTLVPDGEGTGTLILECADDLLARANKLAEHRRVRVTGYYTAGRIAGNPTRMSGRLESIVPLPVSEESID